MTGCDGASQAALSGRDDHEPGFAERPVPGLLDLRAFDQPGPDLLWVDRHARVHHVREISDSYVAALVAYLETHCAQLYAANVGRFAFNVIDDMLAGQASGEILALQARGSILDTTPRAWLNGTPLMRALRARLAGPQNRSA